MYKLITLYEQRLSGINLDTTVDLETLLLKNEKKFYFALMYFFLIHKDLGDILRLSPVLGAAVAVFCESCSDPDISDYYSQYLSLNEIAEQIGKIYNEVQIMSKRESM